MEDERWKDKKICHKVENFRFNIRIFNMMKLILDELGGKQKSLTSKFFFLILFNFLFFPKKLIGEKL